MQSYPDGASRPVDHVPTETGAVRSAVYSGDQPGQFSARLDLLLRNPKGLRALARAYGEGALKYGRDNRLKGFKESVYLQHALDHLINYAMGDQSEDHLGHALWNLFELCWVKEDRKDLLDVTGPDPGPDRKKFYEIAEEMAKIAKTIETTRRALETFSAEGKK